MSKNNIMIDIETLATTNNAVIASIGAVFFTPDTGEITQSFMTNIRLRGQIDNGRYIDADTLQWWFSQEKEAQNALFTQSAVGLDEALKELATFISQSQKINNESDLCSTRVWSNGSNFDIVILTDAYDQCNLGVPWSFRSVRDVRTIVDLSSHLVEYGDTKFEGVKHDPLADAVHQAKYVSKMWQALKGIKNET